jgi:hypothetical protein
MAGNLYFHRCGTRVKRLVAHVEQELLTVPEYLEVIHVLELGSCVSKTHNTMAKRQNTYLAMGHEYVQQRPLISNYCLLGDDASCIYK